MKLSRRVKASRANGAKSRGPKTPEGKLRSQTHAIRHGLLANCVVIEGEDPEIFKSLIGEMEDFFHPVDGVELNLLEEMAAAYWRMRRGWTIEAELLNQGIRGYQFSSHGDRVASAFTNNPEVMHKLELIQRYESRLHRMFQRAFHNLLLLREFKEKHQSSEHPNPVSEHPPEIQPTSNEPVTNTAPKPAKLPAAPFLTPAPAEIPPPAPKPRREPPNPEEKPAA